MCVFGDIVVSSTLNPHPLLFTVLLSFPYVSPVFFSLLSLLMSVHFCVSLPFLPHPFPSLNVCIALAWDWPCLTYIALAYARLPAKPRQPCSTGRCSRTCAAPRRTAKTQLRLLQSALWRLPLRVWPLASLCSLALEGRQVTCSCQVTRQKTYRPLRGLKEGDQGQPGTV